jgi:hypothetical protein
MFDALLAVIAWWCQFVSFGETKSACRAAVASALRHRRPARPDVALFSAMKNAVVSRWPITMSHCAASPVSPPAFFAQKAMA